MPLSNTLQVPVLYWAAEGSHLSYQWTASEGSSDDDDDTSVCAALLMEDMQATNRAPYDHELRAPPFEGWHPENLRLASATCALQKLAVIHAHWWESPDLARFPLLAERRAYNGPDGQPPFHTAVADTWKDHVLSVPKCIL